MPKVLLVQPSQYGANGQLIKQHRLYLPSLVFPLLSALTPKQWEVEVKIEIIEDIKIDTDADIIGIGTMGHSIFRAFDLADAFRKSGKKVFLGGFMASMIPQMAKEHADSVIIGDAEHSYPFLLNDFENTGTIEPFYDHQLDDLKGIPLPKYEVLLEKKIGFMLPVQAGRGCHYNCSFCSIACIYKGKYLSRPIGDVIRDIRRIKELGFKRFYLIDDNIVSNPGFLEELCREIKPLHMTWATQCSMNLAKDIKLLSLVADSGCRVLSLGLESITQEGLNKLNKSWLKVEEHENLLMTFRKAGIMVSAEWIIGTDSDTEESLKAMLKFIMKTKIPLLRIYIITPVPGTSFYNEMKSQSRLIHEDYRHYTASHVVHYPALITPENLTAAYHWLNKNIFSWHGILKRTLFHPDLLKSPGEYLYAFIVNLHYRAYLRKGDLPIIL